MCYLSTSILSESMLNFIRSLFKNYGYVCNLLSLFLLIYIIHIDRIAIIDLLLPLCHELFLGIMLNVWNILLFSNIYNLAIKICCSLNLFLFFSSFDINAIIIKSHIPYNYMFKGFSFSTCYGSLYSMKVIYFLKI